MPEESALKPQWFQILLAVADRDLHGLGVMKAVLEQTDGQMKLWPAMLYRSLKRMAAAGLLEECERPTGPETDGDRRRFYAITDTGRRALSREVARLAKFVRAAEAKHIPIES